MSLNSGIVVISSFVNVIFVDVSTTFSSSIPISLSIGNEVVTTGKSGILLIIYSSDVISVVISL